MSDLPTDRAASPNEKRQVLNSLLDLWLAHPDLRLGQLIANFIDKDRIYNIEDFALVYELELMYESLKRKK